MKFQFEKTVHDMTFDKIKRVSLVDNRVMGEKYRYVLNVRFGNVVYHISAYALMPHKRLMRQEIQRMVNDSCIRRSRLAQRMEHTANFQFTTTELNERNRLVLQKMQRDYEEGLRV